MENMVYTQDPIHLKAFEENPEDITEEAISHIKEMFSEEQLPIFHQKSKYSEILRAYYEVNLISFQLQI